jgi:PAS domain S-box-containing protein
MTSEEQKVGQQELDAEQFRLAVEAAPNGMIMIDESGCIRLVNAQTEEMFGYRRAELIGRPVEMLVPERYQASHAGQRRDFFAGPQRRLMGEGRDLFGLRKDGREFPIEIGLKPFVTRAGTFVLSTVIDITERRRARDELEARRREAEQQAAELERRAAELVEARNAAVGAVRAKSEFLANMSHEIRTPLTAILGYAELLSDARLRREDRAQYLDTVRRNGAYLLTLVNDVLDLSKIDAGKMMVEHVPSSPAELLREVETLMRPRVEAKGLELAVAWQGNIPGLVMTDPTRIRQILVNLVSNAIKFTEIGRIGIELQAESTRPGHCLLRFSVSDTGVGITPEVRQRLFEPFVQADASTTRRFGGTGLGLAICSRLAAAIGGEISVESERWKGSTFRVSFEATRVSSTSMATAMPRRASLSRTRDARSLPRLRGRILLAEDAPDSQRLLSYYLRKAGADVVVAENGKVACERSMAALQAGQPFDVVLMDMQMPAMDGYEASRSLRRLGYRGPIIALTAHAMEGDRERCLAAGCTDYVVKPVDRDTLLRCVRDHLGGTRPGKSLRGGSPCTPSDAFSATALPQPLACAKE